MQEEPKS